MSHAFGKQIRRASSAALLAVAFSAFLIAPPIGAGGDELPRSGWYEKRWLPGGKVVVSVDNGTDLCRTLLEQAMQLAEAGEDWCTLPLPDRKAGISLPKWMPENPDDHLDMLRIVTPNAVFDDLFIRERLMAEIPGLDYAGANEEFWRRYGESLLDMLRRGEATLESIRYDFERDGSPEKIYRMTGLELATDAPDKISWKVRHCAPLKPESPVAHVLFLGPADTERFYPYLKNYGKSEKLFYYGPGLYHIFSSPKRFDFGDVVTSIAVGGKISGKRREVFYRQACGAALAPPDLPPPPDIPPLR